MQAHSPTNTAWHSTVNPTLLMWSLIVGLVATCSIGHAHAGMYNFGPGYGMMGGQVYIEQQRNMLYRNQYYNFDVSGLFTLCEENAELCAAPEQQVQLADLHQRRTAGLIVGGIGLGLLVASPVSIVPLARRFQTADFPYWVPLTLFGSGAVLTIVGGALQPRSKDVMRFVNHTNVLHPESPIQLSIASAIAPAPRAHSGLFTLTYRFYKKRQLPRGLPSRAFCAP